MKNEMILITGSNSGLGLHFAKLALQDKKKVILHGRNAQKLEKYKVLKTPIPPLRLTGIRLQKRYVQPG